MYVTIKEAVPLLNISRQGIHWRIKKGKLKYKRLGKKYLVEI